MVYASVWTTTALVGDSKPKVVEVNTEEVGVMRGVGRDARPCAQQLNKQPVTHQSMLRKQWKSLPRLWVKEMEKYEESELTMWEILLRK